MELMSMKLHGVALATTLSLMVAFGTNHARAAAPPGWQGMQLRHEILDSIEAVNGVPLHIEWFAGADVQRLLARWLEHWRLDASTVARQFGRSGTWQLHSRLLSPGTQEILQVRGTGESSELLWSSVALDPLLPLDRLKERLPAGCIAGPRVSGRETAGVFEVQSAICRKPTPRLPASARSAAERPPCTTGSTGTSFCVVPLPWRQGSGGSALVILRSSRPVTGR